MNANKMHYVETSNAYVNFQGRPVREIPYAKTQRRMSMPLITKVFVWIMIIIMVTQVADVIAM